MGDWSNGGGYAGRSQRVEIHFLIRHHHWEHQVTIEQAAKKRKQVLDKNWARVKIVNDHHNFIKQAVSCVVEVKRPLLHTQLQTLPDKAIKLHKEKLEKHSTFSRSQNTYSKRSEKRMSGKRATRSSTTNSWETFVQRTTRCHRTGMS